MNCRDGVHKVMSCHVSLFTLVRPANGWKTLEAENPAQYATASQYVSLQERPLTSQATDHKDLQNCELMLC
jgi:hypothetical protein